jgi:hypothetical protein
MSLGSKNLFQSFGTLQGDAIDRSDSNSHLGSDPLLADYPCAAAFQKVKVSSEIPGPAFANSTR